MLYIFDVDGCLIEGFLETRACEVCGGEGRHHTDHAPGGFEKCSDCKGKGQVFAGHLPYYTVTLLPRRLERIFMITKEDPFARFAFATNQGGVAMGYQEPGEVWDKMARVFRACRFFYGKPFSLHVAMHHPEPRKGLEEWLAPEGYDLRKPGPGMLNEALASHFGRSDTMVLGDVSWEAQMNQSPVIRSTATPVKQHAVFIGDLATDRDAAEGAGVRFEWSQDFFGDR